MLKKLLSLALVLSLLCSACFAETNDDTIPDFKGMNDPALLPYVEDTLYASLVDALGSEDYIIENLEAVYISQEYLDELAFNSQTNIFFGYTLAEIKDEFQDSAFIFTLGNDGSTVVQPFKDYDDTFDRIIRNVAIGTGVILFCVTVSAITAGAGLVTTSLIFAAAAESGAKMALSSMAIGGVIAGVVKGYETGDMNEALKAAALQGSEAFKWGAIGGTITGGLEEYRLIQYVRKLVEEEKYWMPGTVEISENLLPWQQAELRALNEYGGYYQLSYLDGKAVGLTPGATRPDVIRVLGDHLEAIEVKYYDLENSSCLSKLYSELEREVAARVANLPVGSTQRIVLDVTERGYTLDTVQPVADHIWGLLENTYPEIPIDFVGLVPI